VLQVEVLDVQRQDFGGTGGGLVEHPPQGLLLERDVAAGQQPVDGGLDDRAGLVGPLFGSPGCSNAEISNEVASDLR
jgi:hypothetical protein